MVAVLCAPGDRGYDATSYPADKKRLPVYFGFGQFLAKLPP